MKKDMKEEIWEKGIFGWSLGLFFLSQYSDLWDLQ
jgi:hypothetical protein